MDARTRAPTAPPTALTRARVAVSIVFFILGASTGIWAVHIPIVQARLGIDPGILGLALLVLAVGAISGMLASGWILARHGSRPPTAILALLLPIAGAVPLVSGTTPFLFVSVLAFGLALGGLDVAMNTQASEVEAARGRPSMSAFHAFYSLGGLAGAAVGAGVIAAGWGDGTGGVGAAVCLLAAAVPAASNLWPSERPVDVGPGFTLPNRAALGLGAIVFLCFATEGAVVDWSALYLTRVKLSTATLAAAGFGAFSVAMTVVRLIGDGVVARVGEVPTVFLGGTLVALGIAVAVVAPWPLVAALGFGLVGVGAANIVPVVFSAASRIPGMPPSLGIAAVVTLAYTGFLVSPPILGFVASAWGLTASLVLVGLMGVAMAASAGQVRQ